MNNEMNTLNNNSVMNNHKNSMEMKRNPNNTLNNNVADNTMNNNVNDNTINNSMMYNRVLNNPGAHVITAVVKENGGEIGAYRLENGEIIMKNEAVKMAKEGKISGVIISTSKHGEEYLRAIGDGNTSNNLSNLMAIEYSETH